MPRDEVSLGEMQNLTCDLNVDTEISHRAIDDYVDKLNCIMHDSAREAGCYAEQHYKRKAYWCPEFFIVFILFIQPSKEETLNTNIQIIILLKRLTNR